MASEDLMAYMAGQENNGGNDMFGGNGLWGLLALALVFGGGFGGFGGFGGGGAFNGALTRAELYDGFATQNIDNAIRGVQQGICDSTYALNNAINSGFYGVDRSICDVSHQISDCCCTTQRAIDGVNYNMATQFCALGNTIQSGIRDVIDNQNAGTREILNFLTQDKIATLTAENQSLKFAASQADQNAVIRAAIDASTAEIIRRTGNDCPVPSYLVQPPTPVNFPLNGCGTVQFGGNGCGCGCG